MKLLNRVTLLFFLTLVSHSPSLFSQNELEVNCGNTTTTKSVDFFNSIKPQLKAFERDFTQKKFSKNSKHKDALNSVPVKAHIIRNSDGSGGLDIYDLEKAITNLNKIYKGAYLEFFLLDDVNYINDNQLYHLKKGNEKNLITANYIDAAINIYFIEDIENASEESICGYTDDDEKNNVIVIKNSCATNDSSLAHEMGHFFSLMHTHGPSNTKLTTELVDGSNCDTDGDGICDTPADPKLSSNTIDNFCGYTGKTKDANGDPFNPDTGNIMSYSRKACRNHFTEQQFARIYAYYKLIEDRFKASTDKDPDVIIKEEIAKLSDLKIYPNPVSDGKINFNSSQIESSVYYLITDFRGQILSKGKLTNGEIDVNQLSSGSYLLVLENAETRVVKKFLK